jgi:Protein of unknown function (DUF3618)
MRAMARPDPLPPEPGPDAGIEDIQADIERTRRELGDTVGALSAKLDVKERAKQKAAETKEHVVDRAQTVRHVATEDPRVKVPLIAVLVLGALAAGIAAWRKRR